MYNQLLLCRNKATYECTSSVARRYTQIATSQKHNTSTKTNKYNVQSPISKQCH